MTGVIPGNMRDGSFIVRGKGNPEALCSSSHGAGRVMGRAEAKRTLDMATFRKEMEDRGIQARVEDATLDEAASAYKDIFAVMAMQQDLVEVIHHIKPLINIKG
jgi:tRNA-splicing ligase RtcB